MANPISAMATWVGALARGGLLFSAEEEQGAELALAVLGEARLVELREWFASQDPDVVSRERRGAIHACVWMAQADRELHPEELELLESIIANSELSASAQEELVAALEEPLAPDDVSQELTQPGLRELMLALSWELALSDQRVGDLERTAHRDLADAFGVSDERAAEIRDAVVEASR